MGTGESGSKESRSVLRLGETEQLTVNRKLEFVLNDAAKSYHITERAIVDMVHMSCVQFSEILKIKLRSRVLQYKFHAHRLWSTLEENGARFFVPSNVRNVNWNIDTNGLEHTIQPHSGGTGSLMSPGVDTLKQVGSAVASSVFLPLTGKLGLAGISFGAFIYYFKQMLPVTPSLIVLGGCVTGVHLIQQKLNAQELCKYLNVILAFEENGEDELGTEQVIREISEQIAIRHVNQICKLSKNGQKVLASVVVDRICRHIARHRFGFDDESLIWYIRDMQQFAWSAQLYWKQLMLPADRVTARPRMSLSNRCIRALSAEAEESDERLLELEPFHEAPVSDKVKSNHVATPWTAAGVLSKSAVFVHEAGQIFVHSQTDYSLYGCAYGTMKEVQYRRLEPKAVAPQEPPTVSKL
mmetsp:Transcript_4400/g.6559  ORF Transcript_4400/g.6559 Transcript_4400/m.6559 type:complete len:411 (+) Transcript_4400:485-1717(+)|eukprot:CAMPEP_0203752198 /NCGR_PEP_ID=MMETSP0098-20131031/6147_1 /ASSEMBLY_ACC=CAM_ASM_000208 /TAXON_ID=96639 /ORGANISM=" , Strain NY0313808BC1" /LENGTH=410 /DNA_ID=CAMNT_0050642247 /DNA_START=456 /DNA_END=1688 /DNA_ORIENTATION=-